MGDKSARTVGAILTLAAAQTERKKKCSADAKRTMPSAVGDQRLDLRRSLQRSASVIYTYTPCIYIYKYWTHCAKRTSPDGTIFVRRVTLICEIVVRVIAWQLYISVTIDSSLARFAATQLSIFRQMRVNGLTKV